MSRVTEIRYVGYGVVDFDAEKAFYGETWGLDLVDETADHAWFKAQGDGYQTRINAVLRAFRDASE